MELRRWTRMSAGVLLTVLMGMGCQGCGPETKTFIDQPDDYTKVAAEEDATPGEFYMFGIVVRQPGPYSLVDPQLTMKRALAAGGISFGPILAYHAILFRQLADGQEQVTAVDIGKVFRGEQEDIVIIPNDTILIGTSLAEYESGDLAECSTPGGHEPHWSQGEKLCRGS